MCFIPNFKLRNQTTGVAVITLPTQNTKRAFWLHGSGNRTLTHVSENEQMQLFIVNTKKATFNMAGV